MVLSWHQKEITLVFLASIILSFLLFSNVISGKFVGDDFAVVSERADLKSLENIPEFFTSPAFPGSAWIGLYRPITLSSYAFNFLFSDSPAGFHILNIILHALNVFLVFLITAKFASKKIAYTSAGVFMFLPIHTEAISSIVGRSELLSAFFVLSALLLFFKKKHVWASLAFLCALLSKEFAVVFLPIIGSLLLMEAIEVKKLKKYIIAGLYYLPPLVIYFLLRFITLGRYAFGGIAFNPVTAPLAFLGLKERIFNSFLSLFLYLRKSFYPVDLSPDYSFNQIPAIHNIFSSPQAIIGLILFIGFIAIIIFGQKSLKIAAIILLVPFVFISNMLFVTSGSFAERWWYLPSFGLTVMVAIFIERLATHYKKTQLPIAILLISMLLWFSLVTIKQNRIWLTNRALIARAAEMSPNSSWARSNLASIYLSDKNFEMAKHEVEAGLAIYPQNVTSLKIMGQLYWNDGNFKLSADYFKKAIEAGLATGQGDINSRVLYRMLAFLNFDFGRSREALFYMKKAIQFPPARGSEDIVNADDILYKFITDNADRSFNSYSQAEKQRIISLIKTVRGF